MPFPPALSTHWRVTVILITFLHLNRRHTRSTYSRSCQLLFKNWKWQKSLNLAQGWATRGPDWCHSFASAPANTADSNNQVIMIFSLEWNILNQLCLLGMGEKCDTTPASEDWSCPTLATLIWIFHQTHFFNFLILITRHSRVTRKTQTGRLPVNPH